MYMPTRVCSSHAYARAQMPLSHIVKAEELQEAGVGTRVGGSGNCIEYSESSFQKESSKAATHVGELVLDPDSDAVRSTVLQRRQQ